MTSKADKALAVLIVMYATFIAGCLLSLFTTGTVP